MSINKESIRSQLNTELLGTNIILLDKVDSTNSYLKQSSFPIGTLVMAKEQTGGRGRRGRCFWSPEGGVYMSVLYKPSGDFNPGKITSCVALAVCKAIEKITDLTPKIKWVNDVFLNDKKLCGILCEAVSEPSSSKIDSVIIGIGINVEDISVPAELQDVLTNLNRECGRIVSKNLLIAEILNALEIQLSTVDAAEFVRELKNRSYVLGKKINVITPTESYEAYAEDIDSDCQLVIKRGDDRIILSSGEISVRNI